MAFFEQGNEPWDFMNGGDFRYFSEYFLLDKDFGV
jgi:hypothetical protein